MDNLSDGPPDGPPDWPPDWQDQITPGEVLRRIGLRGFGPILVIVAGLLLLPTGTIPGVPGAVAIVPGPVAVERVTGGKAIRLPDRLARSGPVTRVIGQLPRPRASLPSTSRTGHVATGHVATGIILGPITVVMFVAGFVPGLPFLPSVPVFPIGLGPTARDGLVQALGLGSVLVPALALSRFLT